MKASQSSGTALLIARAVLLADATPALRPLLVDNSVELTRRLLDIAQKTGWFDFVMHHRIARAALLALERAALPGIIVHWLARKCLLDALAREALGRRCRQ